MQRESKYSVSNASAHAKSVCRYSLPPPHHSVTGRQAESQGVPKNDFDDDGDDDKSDEEENDGQENQGAKTMIVRRRPVKKPVGNPKQRR
jgi:hypothetical protein